MSFSLFLLCTFAPREDVTFFDLASKAIVCRTNPYLPAGIPANILQFLSKPAVFDIARFAEIHGENSTIWIRFCGKGEWEINSYRTRFDGSDELFRLEIAQGMFRLGKQSIIETNGYSWAANIQTGNLMDLPSIRAWSKVSGYFPPKIEVVAWQSSRHSGLRKVQSYFVQGDLAAQFLEANPDFDIPLEDVVYRQTTLENRIGIFREFIQQVETREQIMNFIL